MYHGMTATKSRMFAGFLQKLQCVSSPKTSHVQKFIASSTEKIMVNTNSDHSSSCS